MSRTLKSSGRTPQALSEASVAALGPAVAAALAVAPAFAVVPASTFASALGTVFAAPASASGAGAREVNMSIAINATPTQIEMSATLNVGQCLRPGLIPSEETHSGRLP